MRALEFQQVYFRQGNFLLHNINFEIEMGSTVALTGPSGSGKSTIISLIGNATEADAGKILYFGRELYENEKEIRKELAVVYDSPNFNLEFKAGKLAKEISRFEPWFDLELFHEKMELLGLDEHKRVRSYSKGNRKKYMFLLALCRKPRLLVMDEPTSGVDEKARQCMYGILDAYRREHELTILFSTHNDEERDLLADRVIRIEKGVIQ